MLRKIVYVDQAKTFMDFVPDGIPDQSLAELIVHVQTAVHLSVLKEADGDKTYEVKKLDTKLFMREGRVRVWITSTRDIVVCFAVEASRTSRSALQDPTRWG